MSERWSARLRHTFFSSAAIAAGVLAGTLLSGVQARETPSDTLISLDVPVATPVPSPG